MCRAFRDRRARRRRHKTFYAGAKVLLGCFFVQLASAPGHTFGVNSFVDSWVEDLDLTRMQVSTVWLVASLCSAVGVPFSGMALDRYGARRLVLYVGPSLVLVVLLLSRVQGGFGLACLVALTRFLGPECLVLTAQTTTQRWYVRRRGRATALLSLSFLILQMMPPFLAMAIAKIGWRNTYLCMAGVMTVLLLIGRSLLRDTPASIGLLPDGEEQPASAAPAPPTAEASSNVDSATELRTVPVEDESSVTSMDSLRPLEGRSADGSVSEDSVGVGEKSVSRVEDGTREDSVSGGDGTRGVAAAAHNAAPLAASSLREAAAHPIFWFRGAVDATFGTFWAGFNYNYISYVSSLGGELAELSAVQIGAAVFVPLAMTTIGMQFVVGTCVIDRLSTRTCMLLVALLHAALALLTYVSLALRSQAELWAWTLVYGCTSGMRGAFSSVLNAQLYGTAALGAINGLSTGVSLGASGIGPLVYSLSLAFTGHYNVAVTTGSAVHLAGSLALTGSTLRLFRQLKRREGAERLP